MRIDPRFFAGMSEVGLTDMKLRHGLRLVLIDFTVLVGAGVSIIWEA